MKSLDIFSFACFGAVAFLSLSTTLRVVSLIRTDKSSIQTRYEDDDGVATEKTESGFRKSSAWQKTLLCVCTAGGIIITIIRIWERKVGLGNVTKYCWADCSFWPLFAPFPAAILSELEPRGKSGLVEKAVIVILFRASQLWANAIIAPQGLPGPAVLTQTEFGLLFAIFVSLVAIPLRPQVFHKNEPVDRKWGASLLSLYSFSWASKVQLKARQQSLSLSDLPCVGHDLRSRTLDARFQQRKGTGKFWTKLLRAFLGPLTQQWIIALLKSLASFSVQVSIHRLLQQLEGDPTATCNWIAALAFSLFAEMSISCWLQSFGETSLEIPTTAQIILLVFQKSLHRKISHQSQRHGDESEPEIQISEVNILRADISTLTMFWGHSINVPLALFKIFLNAAFLIPLMGLRSVISGFAICAILVPFSTTLSKNYASLQSNLTRCRDATMNRVAEALHALPQIRFLSLEETWIAEIMSCRMVEIKEAWKVAVAMGLVNSFIELSPVLLSAASISIYALEHGILRPSIIFTSLGLFSDIHSSLRTLPQLVADIYESWISYKRIERYLEEPEVEQFLSSSENIIFEKASFGWPSTSAPKEEISGLHNITVSFVSSRLNVVNGPTGSGKSLLLATLLNETNLKSGKVSMPEQQKGEQPNGEGLDWITPGSAALVSQPPWIDNATVRENILFGLRLKPSRYQDVIQACSLERDIDQMKQGDATKVGAKGAMLSGGQRWRIALARAIYSRASILLLDDVLSAVDGAVAQWLVKHALTGALAHGRTTILVTHNLDVCIKHASFLVELEEHTVKRATLLNPAIFEEVETRNVIAPSNKVLEDVTREEPPHKRLLPASGGLRLSQSTARPSLKAPLAYMHAAGGWKSGILALTATASFQLFSVGTSWWLMRWTAESQGGVATLRYHLGVYLLLSLLVGLSKTAQHLVYARLGLNASQFLFQSMLHAVLKAPLSWITGVPAGQLITSFGADFQSIDSYTSQEINGLISDCAQLAIVMGTSLIYAPPVLLAAIVLAMAFFSVVTDFRATSQAFRKLIPAGQSPIFEHLNSITTGLITIRAFGRANHYQEKVYDLIDQRTKVGWHLSLGIKWMNFRMGALGTAFVTVVAAIIVARGADAALAGLTITLAMQLYSALSQMVRRYGKVKSAFLAVDRIVEYIEHPIETQAGDETPNDWPPWGRVVVQDLSVSYKGSLALEGINFSIDPGQRVGIVGRTGAGKTTLAHSFLRFVEPDSGKITIDGIKISSLKLSHLRRGITIIPQEPFLFTGTLRSNLDLYGKCSDEEVENVLRRVGLNSTQAHGSTKPITSSICELDSRVSDGGMNISHGQRQLICLARALLSRSRLLIFDEATSSVDPEADAMIQKVIRKEFSGCTIMVIAHRLSTIEDFDQVIVLDSAKVAEKGSPDELIRKKGWFWKMKQRG